MISKANSKTTPHNGKKPTMASLRLQKDLQSYKQTEIPFVELSFLNQASIQEIIVSITLNLTAEEAKYIKTPYNRTKTKFSLQFPDSYPIDPPKLKCISRIFHPNINYSGSVCLPLLREDWSPTVSLSSIICGLIYILQYPNGEDALEPDIGDQMKQDYIMFEKIVKHTCEGRNFKNKEYDPIRI